MEKKAWVRNEESGAHKAMKRVLIFLVTLGIIVPILFVTAGQMGLFSPEPTVEIEAGITSEFSAGFADRNRL